MSQLDNPYSSMVEMFREQGSKYNSPDLMMGEVISISPMAIRVGSIQLDKDNLYFADYLLEGYKRDIEFEGKTNISGGSVTGNMTNTTIPSHGSHTHTSNSTTIASHGSHTHTTTSASVSEHGSHNHTVSSTTISAHASHNHSLNSTSITEHGSHTHKLTSLNVTNGDCRQNGSAVYSSIGLKAGDRVAIQQLRNSNNFIVYCKLQRVDY